MIKKTRFYSITDNRGSFIGAALIIIIVLTAIGISLSEVVISQYVHTKKNTFVANALLVAEAGVEQSMLQLNSDDNFTGYSSQQEFFNNSNQGKGVYTSSITTAPTGSSKVITSVGKVFNQNDLIKPVSTRTVKVTIVGTESEGYSVQTGPGGLILSGSANILNSDVYVKGYISMSGSARIGTNNNPQVVHVAHKKCPNGASPGPTYPQVCTTGQPISLTGSSRIYGSVCATGQTTSTGILPGNGGSGLMSGCVADPNIDQPSYDRVGHISRMSPLAGYASNNPTYTCGGSQTKTWPTNLRLNGNVTLGGSCKLTISGDVYITGDLNIGGSAQVTVAPGLTNRPVIVVDGKITSGGSGALIANSGGVGFHLISFKSSAACGATCTTMTGNDLYNSQRVTTVDVGGSASLAGMIFQAYWGKATIGGSGNIGAVAGQTVDFSGSGTVTFGTILSSGNKIWTVTSYQQIYE